MPVKARAGKAAECAKGEGSVLMFQEIQPFKRRSAAMNQGDTAPLPGVRSWERLRPKNWLFLATVVVPSLISILYYGFIASDVYISESKFVVRSPDKPAVSGLGVILKSAGFANAGDELYAAQSFASSRDALRALNRNGAFEKAYTRPQISIIDRFDPLGISHSFESLYRYFGNKVGLQNDSSSFITTLSVRAYTPEDAQRFNEQLLEMSEATVNRLNERGQQDLVRYAENEVDQAKAKSQAAAAAIAAYQNRSGVVDPAKQAQAQMEMISKLQDNLIASKTELAQLEHYAPENPRIPVIRTQIATIQGEMNRQLGTVVGNSRSLTAAGVRFQRLQLENDFAGKQLAAALASLEQVRSESQRKQAYVERIVEPNLPDQPVEPNRLRGILATFALSLLAYGILRMLLAGVREHAL
jgi:capsular polysaccharide transport system permease protein